MSRSPSARQRYREPAGRRAAGIGLAVGLEALLLLLLLTIGQVKLPDRFAEVGVVKLINPTAERAAEPAPASERESREPEPSPPQEHETAEPEPPRPAQPPADQMLATAEPLPRDIMPISRDQLPAANIARPPAAPAAPARRGVKMGPPDTRPATDTPRVGTGPNGEPLYAASWYREPSDSELRGYLSTASGPGWGLIACRTVPDFRVEDCVGLDEYPNGSNITRAVLAAAWQFRVRPPRIGGRLQVGEWVRIRIELTPGSGGGR